MPNKTAVMRPTRKEDGSGEIGMAVYGLAQSIESVAEELRPLYKIEDLADNLGQIAQQLADQARAQELALIAQYGTAEDRRAVVEYLKAHTAPFSEY